MQRKVFRSLISADVTGTAFGVRVLGYRPTDAYRIHGYRFGASIRAVATGAGQTFQYGVALTTSPTVAQDEFSSVQRPADQGAWVDSLVWQAVTFNQANVGGLIQTGPPESPWILTDILVPALYLWARPAFSAGTLESGTFAIVDYERKPLTPNQFARLLDEWSLDKRVQPAYNNLAGGV